MPPRRRGTRAQPTESVNQQRGDPVVNEGSEEDIYYNEYDEEEYIEEEAEDTHQGGNPVNEFMELLRANLNQQPIPPQPPTAQQTAATVFRAFKSLKPPEFLGFADPVEARAWLKEIGKSFEILGVEERHKTIFTSYMLKGEANYWWESKRNLETDAVIPWDRFTQLFLDKYFPRFMETQMEIRFLELKQDKMTVAEYEAKFTELSRFVPEFMNTEEKKARSEQTVKEKENRKRKIGSQGIGTGNRSLPSRFVRGAVSQSARGPGFRKAPSESVGQGGGQSRVTFHSQPRAPIPECQTCTLLLNYEHANVLFDSGATKSFISQDFASKLKLNAILLREVLRVEIANKEIIPVNQIYPKCKLKLEEEIFEVDLIPFALGEFDVILGMDWLSRNGAQIDCEQKRVKIRVQNDKEVVFKGQRQNQKFLTMLQAKRLLRKGNEAYLAYVIDTQKEVPNIQDIPIVNEFEDVFPENLPGLPPDREIEFAIELAPGTAPVSKAPYRLDPVEMKELASQLQ
ncbi:hypothetical protein AgCh_000664 [Apium graveolens]